MRSQIKMRAHELHEMVNTNRPERTYTIIGCSGTGCQASESLSVWDSLKRNLKKAADLGYTFYVGPELEFFYFKNAESTEGLDRGGYFDMTPLDVATDLRRDSVLALEELGVDVEYSHHEVAGSQHEIDMRYTDALTMADNVMTYRLVVKQIALQHGV